MHFLNVHTRDVMKRIDFLFQAYWIAHRACKYVFDDIDDLAKSPHPISYIWPAMRDFFQVKDRTDMLPHLYSNFDKSKFSMFAKEIALGCEKNDPLCLAIFEENGRLLARHIVALFKKAHNVSFDQQKCPRSNST